MPLACCEIVPTTGQQTPPCNKLIAMKLNVTGCEDKIHDFMHDNTKTMEITFSVLIAVQVSLLFKVTRIVK